jgi:hypothetical protein
MRIFVARGIATLSLLAVVVGSSLLITVPQAKAQAPCIYGEGNHCPNRKEEPADPPTPVSVPEIDPSTGMAALALLGGAVMVIRGRRAK